MSQVLKKYPLVIKDIRKYFAEKRKEDEQQQEPGKSSSTRRRGRSGGAADLDSERPGRAMVPRSRIFSQYDDPMPLDHYIHQ